MVFDRFKERMRQGTGLSKDMGHFKGTDNARVEDMMKEADDFAHRLGKYKKTLNDTSSATKGLLESTQKTLSADLPKLYDRDAEGKAFGKPTANNASQSVKVHGLADLVTRQEAELKAQVYTPIDNWLAAHKEFNHKLKKLDNFRLDLDNSRRQHNRSDLERVRHQQKSDNVPDHVLSKIQEQSTDLQGKRDAWTKYESEVHAELTELVGEAANMHIHLAAALRIEADILTSALANGGGALGQAAAAGPLGGARLSQPQASGQTPLAAAQSPVYTGAFQTAPGSQNLSDPQYVQMST